MTEKLAGDIEPGDHFIVHVMDKSIDTVALRKPEPWNDTFGRAMLRFWARRLDTGAEGWMNYGPTGVIDVLESTPLCVECGKEPWGFGYCGEYCQNCARRMAQIEHQEG